MARDFDGSTGALRSTATPGFTPEWVISLWVNADALPSTGNVCYVWTRQNAINFNNWFGIFIDSNGKAHYHRHVAASSPTDYAQTTNAITAGSWYHIAAYDDGANWYCWINGTGRGNRAGAGPSVGAAAHTVLGARETAATPTYADYFDGRIAEVVEWDNSTGFGPLWAMADTEAVALAAYQSHIKAGKFFRPGGCRYIPLLRDEDTAIMMPNTNPPSTFGVSGTVAVGEHPWMVDPWDPVGPLPGNPTRPSVAIRGAAILGGRIR